MSRVGNKLSPCHSQPGFVSACRRQPETIMSISSRLLSNSMSSHSLVGLISPQAGEDVLSLLSCLLLEVLRLPGGTGAGHTDGEGASRPSCSPVTDSGDCAGTETKYLCLRFQRSQEQQADCSGCGTSSLAWPILWRLARHGVATELHDPLGPCVAGTPAAGFDSLFLVHL